MRLFIFLLAFALFSPTASAKKKPAKRAKYVFYFIGDGMGVNQVNGAQTYLAALQGRIGIEPLCFTQFPYAALVTTYSATNGVTDSAAGGTALATGKKTKNNAIGVLADLKTPARSIAYWAKDAGAAVGITTNVSIDHATPAAFYAHQPHRGMYHEIGLELPASGFDFFAGSDFLRPADPASPTAPTLYDICADSGYTVVRGYPQYAAAAAKAGRMILLPTSDRQALSPKRLPYTIDRTEADLGVEQIITAAVDFLSKKQKDGFFLMLEGGEIDWACHSNDIAPALTDLVDLDRAVRVAYEFYLQHPDETLIVISADHETGGLSLGRGPYELHLDLLQHQRMSAEAYSEHLRTLHQQLDTAFTWSVLEADLQANWGFGSAIRLTDHQQQRLRRAYDKTISGEAKDQQSLYASLDEISDAARRTMAEQALVGWQSGGHSNGYVPAFAIGVGAEQFQGQIDNTEIPVKIARAAGWDVK